MAAYCRVYDSRHLQADRSFHRLIDPPCPPLQPPRHVYPLICSDHTPRQAVDSPPAVNTVPHDRLPYWDLVDLLSGYWQLGMRTVRKRGQHFALVAASTSSHASGLSGALGYCGILRDLLWTICLSYLNDIVIYARTPQELMKRLITVLDQVRVI